MTIEGDYTSFAHLETVLPRRARAADARSPRTSRRVVEAARGKPILFFPARHDHHRVQTGRRLRGPRRRARSASPPTRRRPGGAARHRHRPARAHRRLRRRTRCSRRRSSPSPAPDRTSTSSSSWTSRTTPCARRSTSRARSARRLWGVRLDTSRTLVDRSLWEEMGDFDPRGVNERLVRKVRDALDADGFERVKIVVSGGFDVERIRAFEASGRAGRLLRRRLGAHPRRERLHRRHRPRRTATPSAKVGPQLPPEPAARARRLARPSGFRRRLPMGPAGGAGSRTSSTTFRIIASRGCR